MRTYILVANDKYELPVSQEFKTAAEVGTYLDVSANVIRQRRHRNRPIGEYRVICIDDEQRVNKKAYQKRYRMLHDQSEYFRERYRKVMEV